MSTDTMTVPPRHARRTELSADLKVSQWGVIRSEWLKFWSLRSSIYSLVICGGRHDRAGLPVRLCRG